ncbi:hypothetical protein BGY98DRAFT_947356 [Russula aff. rugulosa BPL654]|nr:hypothetical protein BGY98DRAFT_947356 [Russula aff. rugulosa BPL654]
MPSAPPLNEGHVVGVGYRPRSGTIRADGPCSLHGDLGQDGFVFIEYNVKKWGFAPSVGTLAPPPAYGGRILLEAGAGVSPPSFESSHSLGRDLFG